MTWFEVLAGTRIERIDAPSHDVLALTLRKPDLKGVLLVHLSGPTRGMGWVERRPQGAPASGAITSLRHHVAGARVEAFEAMGPNILDLLLHSPKRARRLRLALGREQGNAIALDGDGHRLTSLHPVAPHQVPKPQDGEPRDRQPSWPQELAELQRAGLALLGGGRGGATPSPAPTPQDAALALALKRRVAQLRRRLQAIRGDQARGEQAQDLRVQANLLLSALHTIDCSQKAVVVAAHDGSGTRRLEIAPDLSPTEQADAWFKRARKLAKGLQIAREREVSTLAEIERTEALLQRLEQADDPEALAVIAAEALALGLQRAGGPARGGTTVPVRKPYRTFLAAGGARILVGRSAADNDTLTLHHARPEDLWLHARGASGSHVIVPMRRGQDVAPELLRDAALLAAHFSKFKNDDPVEVSYTRKRFVRKPKGSPKGQVRVDSEKVFLVRSDPDRLRTLLSAELREV